MKRPLLQLLLFCALVSAGLPQLPSASSISAADNRAKPTKSAQIQSESAIAVRIARIENGLLPAVVIKGQPSRPMKLADRMKFYKVPGVSVAFFAHGRILWTRAYGLADVAAQRRVTPDTLFQAASISKPVTALAALHLVQERKLSLDENVNEKLHSWKVPENQFTTEQKVTLRRILSHSAGLTVHGFPGYASDEPVPTIVQVLDGEKPANTEPIRVDVAPGKMWRYSGGGYVILQTLLVDVSGKPFPQLLNELVLRPAGMTHSAYEQPLPRNLWPAAATPYRDTGEPVKGGWHTYPELAAAGLWTTPSDLARLAIEVQDEYAGKSSKILSQDMVRQMLTRQQDDWGLGFGLAPPGHKLRFWHSGGNEGYRCDLQAYAETDEGIAVMTNSDSGGAVIQEFVRAVAKEYFWPDFQPVERVLAKIDPALLKDYAGTYEVPNVGKLMVSMKDHMLYVQAGPLGPAPQELYPESATDFFIVSTDMTFKFQKDERGNVSELIVQAGSQTFQAKKIP